MNGKRDFRYDPLYRVMKLTDEIRFIEGNFKSLFDRLKGINNLGIIPEILEMARYSKYEHHIGTLYQIKCLLDCVDKSLIPEKYHQPLILSALFLHVGHLPFTYSTERALLLASNLEKDSRNKAKKYIKKRVEKVLKQANFDDEEQKKHLEKLFSLENYKSLYRYFSCWIFLEKWKKIQEKYELKDDAKETIIRNLIDFENDGYKYLELADKADFVQRDALYFGTVKLDISPEHLYGKRLEAETENRFFSIDEEKLIESNLDYLSERFYDSDRIRWRTRLYEKIVASLILSKNFKMEWLDKFDDSQFKRLITENMTPDNTSANLPRSWIKKAKDLFGDNINFSLVFKLSDIPFEKQKNVIDIEYELLRKDESMRGLLAYPFKTGVLLDIDYSRKPKYPHYPNYKLFSINVFQNDSQIKFIELLKIIEKLSYYCSITHIENIRKGICKQFSWTKSVRFENRNVINVISKAIGNIEKSEKYNRGRFLAEFVKAISSIKKFDKLWYNFENRYLLWLGEYITEEYEGEIKELNILNKFVKRILSLPICLLQYESTKKYLDEIYANLLEMITKAESNEERGYLFEALWLINKIREKRGKFQFLINGMVVVDPTKPKKERDIHEFDVIELLINNEDKAECWIYACSIADDYRQNNEDQLNELARQIHQIYSDLIIRTRYVIPRNKEERVWEPREKQTGVGNWN